MAVLNTSSFYQAVMLLSEPHPTPPPQQVAAALPDLESPVENVVLTVILNDTYRVVEVIGRGGFGTVYKVDNIKTDPIQSFALKASDLSKNGREMQQHEEDMVQFCHALDIPNIIKYIEGFPLQSVWGTQYCSVYELGSYSLYEKTKKQHQTLGYIQHIATQALTTLIHFNSRDFVHGDLKEQNMVVIPGPQGENTIRFIDFGLAFIAGTDKPNETLQTFSYRAPEVVVGQKSLTCAIDMWSLGSMLVRLFRGKELFDLPAGIKSYDEENQCLYKNMTELFGPFPDEMKPKEPLSAYESPTLTKRTVPQKLHHKLFENLSSCEIGQEDITKITEFEDLVCKILTIDPLKRLSPIEALAHPYFVNRSISPLAYPPSLLPLPTFSSSLERVPSAIVPTPTQIVISSSDFPHTEAVSSPNIRPKREISTPELMPHKRFRSFTEIPQGQVGL